MNTFTGGQDYNVTSVEFGIELAASGSGTGQPRQSICMLITVHHSLEAIGIQLDRHDRGAQHSGSGGRDIQRGTDGNAAGLGVGVRDGSRLPNGEAVGNCFFIGSNPDPETGLSYLSAVDCGISDPTPTGDIGFPDMHIVFNVNGSCPGGTPTPTPRANTEALGRVRLRTHARHRDSMGISLRVTISLKSLVKSEW